MSWRNALPFLLVFGMLAVSLPAHAQEEEFDPSFDHAWNASRGHVLVWRMVGCEGELRDDIAKGVARLNKILDANRVDLEFHANPDMDEIPEIAEFGEEGYGRLLVSTVANKAQSDVVVACVGPELYRNVTKNQTELLSYAAQSVAKVNASGEVVYQMRSVVMFIQIDQKVSTPNCHDPRPVGHDLRQVSVMRQMIASAGLGEKSDDPFDVYGPLDEVLNRSCSAWFELQVDRMGSQTTSRLQALWGKAPAPGFSAAVAGSFRDHPLPWALIPLGLIGSLVLVLVLVESRKKAAVRSARPSGVVKRGTKGDAEVAQSRMFYPTGELRDTSDPYGTGAPTDVAPSVDDETY